MKTNEPIVIIAALLFCVVSPAYAQAPVVPVAPYPGLTQPAAPGPTTVPGAATSQSLAPAGAPAAVGPVQLYLPPLTPPMPLFLRGLARSSLTVRGTVARFLVNPPGDVDGLVLTSGEEVRFPPHLGQMVVTALGGRAGIPITASGYGARNVFGTAVEADSMIVGSQSIPLR